MEGADKPSRAPKLLWKFHTKEHLSDFATGCDADIGGTSSVHLELDESHLAPPAETYPTLTKPGVLDAIKTPTGKFWGDMKLGVHERLQGKVRGGYAGFRNMVCHITTSIYDTLKPSCNNCACSPARPCLEK